MHPTYDLSPRSIQSPPPRLCEGCKGYYTTSPIRKCELCAESEENARCLAAMDLASAHRIGRTPLAAVNPETLPATDDQKREAATAAGLMLAVIVLVAILWPIFRVAYNIVHAPVTVGNAMASYGAQGWEGHK